MAHDRLVEVPGDRIKLIAEINEEVKEANKEIKRAFAELQTKVREVQDKHQQDGYDIWPGAEYTFIRENISASLNLTGKFAVIDTEEVGNLLEPIQPAEYIGTKKNSRQLHFFSGALSNHLIDKAVQLLLWPVKKVVEEVTTEIVNSSRSLTVNVNNGSSSNLYDYQCYHKWGNDIDTPPYRICKGQEVTLQFAKRKASLVGLAGAISYKVAGHNVRLVIVYRVPLMNACICIRNNFLAMGMYTVNGNPQELKEVYECLVSPSPHQETLQNLSITGHATMDPHSNSYIAIEAAGIHVCCHLTLDAHAKLVVNIN